MRRLGGGAGRRRERRCASNPADGAGQFPVSFGVAPAAVLTHSAHPGGVGAPPGDTTIPCQELADVDVRSFAAADARLWNGADTGARSLRRLKARSNLHPRNARPDAGDAALNCRQDSV
jgi:hypothetical protein